ncbi:hypothetical protein ES703_82912 [subsurface metagenome]
MAQLVNLVINIGVLLDVEVGAGDIGFRLVVIVVADEVLDGVVGEKFPELLVKLGSQRLVVADDQGGLLRPLDDISHGESLAAAGNAEQRLVPVALIQPLHQTLHRLRLVTRHSKIRDYLKLRHRLSCRVILHYLYYTRLYLSHSVGLVSTSPSGLSPFRASLQRRGGGDRMGKGGFTPLKHSLFGVEL